MRLFPKYRIKKAFRVLIGQIIAATMENMNLSLPVLTGEERAFLEKGREVLLGE